MITIGREFHTLVTPSLTETLYTTNVLQYNPIEAMLEVSPEKEHTSFDALLKKHEELSEEWRRAAIEAKNRQGEHGDFDLDSARAQYLIELASKLRQTEAELIRAAGQ
jgi:hypothetical protein